MSIYSESMNNTPEPNINVPESCYTCTNDCLGVWINHILRGDHHE